MAVEPRPLMSMGLFANPQFYFIFCCVSLFVLCNLLNLLLDDRFVDFRYGSIYLMLFSVILDASVIFYHG